MIALAALCVGVALAGCGKERAGSANSKRSVAFDGVYFKAKAKRVDRRTRERFTVEVRDADRSVPGAMEAARYAGIRYCIEEYGTSDIVWTGQSPDDVPEEIVLTKGDLAMAGECDPT